MAQARIAGMDQKLRRGMIELVGLHRLDEAQIVHLLFQMRHPVGNPGAALSRLVKGKHRPQQLGDALDEGEAFPSEEGLRAVMAVETLEHRLPIEKIELAGRAAHMQIDHPLDLGGELRRQHRQRRRRIAREIQRRGNGMRRGRRHGRIHEQGAEPPRPPADKLAARLRLDFQVFGQEVIACEIGHDYLVSAASRLNKALATAVGDWP